MKQIKFFLTAFLISSISFAGFPPTTSQVSGDASNITTFNFQFPNFTGTHTGVTFALGVNSVAGGGTGVSSYPSGNIAVGAGSSPITFVAPGTSGNVLTSNGSTWQSSAATSPIGVAPTNLLINSDFFLFQRATFVAPTNGNKAIVSDRWWANNGLGAVGVVTDQPSGITLPAGIGIRTAFGSTVGEANELTVTTAPTTAVNGNVYSISQFLDIQTSNLAYNGTVSGSAYVKAIGNITSVTIAVVYNTTQVSTAGNTLGSASCAVNTSTWTLCVVNGVSVGTTPSHVGVIGLAVQSGGVSTGHVSDLNNGFYTAATMMNLGATVAAWAPAASIVQQEIAMAQRFYEKSYDLTTVPGTASAGPGIVLYYPPVTTGYYTVAYKVSKVIDPSVTIYSQISGSSPFCYDSATAGDVNAAVADIGNNAFLVACSGLATQQITFHWSANAEF